MTEIVFYLLCVCVNAYVCIDDRRELLLQTQKAKRDQKQIEYRLQSRSIASTSMVAIWTADGQETVVRDPEEAKELSLLARLQAVKAETLSELDAAQAVVFRGLRDRSIDEPTDTENLAPIFEVTDMRIHQAQESWVKMLTTRDSMGRSVDMDELEGEADEIEARGFLRSQIHEILPRFLDEVGRGNLEKYGRLGFMWFLDGVEGVKIGLVPKKYFITLYEIARSKAMRYFFNACVCAQILSMFLITPSCPRDLKAQDYALQQLTR
jgi:hypothetical protein